MNFLKSLTVSWIPKFGGVLGTIGGALIQSGEHTYGPLLATAGGLIVAFSVRQNNVTSEQAGIKAPEVVVQVTPVVKVVEQPLMPPESGRPK